MPSIPLKHKYLNIIVIMGQFLISIRSLQKSKKKYFSLFEKNGHGIGKKGGHFRLGMGPKLGP